MSAVLATAESLQEYAPALFHRRELDVELLVELVTAKLRKTGISFAVAERLEEIGDLLGNEGVEAVVLDKRFRNADGEDEKEIAHDIAWSKTRAPDGLTIFWYNGQWFIGTRADFPREA